MHLCSYRNFIAEEFSIFWLFIREIDKLVSFHVLFMIDQSGNSYKKCVI